jgi:hypothetical protein
MQCWYEQEGPNAEYVRNHQLGIWKSKVGSNQLSESTIELIKFVLLTHIPDTKTDFGSYRGYNSFGLGRSLLTSIETNLIFKLRARTKAMNVLRRCLAPLVIHRLYRPKGVGYKNIKENTNVGNKLLIVGINGVHKSI